MLSIYPILPVALGPGGLLRNGYQREGEKKVKSLGSRARPVSEADSLTAVCDPINISYSYRPERPATRTALLLLSSLTPTLHHEDTICPSYTSRTSTVVACAVCFSVRLWGCVSGCSISYGESVRHKLTEDKLRGP
jgi:hypothetical protein